MKSGGVRTAAWHCHHLLYDAGVWQSVAGGDDKAYRGAAQCDAGTGGPARALKLGYAVIPSSTKRENTESNLLAQQLLQLSDEDMAQIAALESNGRLVSPEGLAPDWD